MRWRMGLALPCLLFGSCICGCTVTSKGNGSFFLTYGTTLEFGHRTQVADPKQVSELTFNADKAFGMIRAFYDAGPVDTNDQQLTDAPRNVAANPVAKNGPPSD